MKYFACVVACLCLAITAAFAAPPLEAYSHLPATELVTLSPSGARVALVTGSGDDRRIVVSSVDGGVLLSSKTGDIKVRELHWAGDDHLILLSSVTRAVGLYVHNEWHGGELYVATVLNLKTKSASVVFFKAPDLFPTVLGVYGFREIDGHWFGYFNGATRSSGSFHQTSGALVNLYEVDLDTGIYRVAATGEADWVLKDDGTPLVHARTGRNKGTNVWELYAGKFERDPIEARDASLGGYYLYGRGRTADTYLLQQTVGSNTGLWERSLTPGKPPVNLNGKSIVDVLTDDAGLAIGVEEEDDVPVPLLFDPTDKAVFAAVEQAFAPAHVRPVSFGPNKRLIVESWGDTDAGTYYLVDVPTQKVQKLGEEYPELPTNQIGKVRMVQYKAADGLALEGVLTLPPSGEAKNLPLVLLPHGGPHTRDHLGFDWVAQAFAGRGYAVFQPNFRGSGGFSRAFRDAGFGEWGRKMQTDLSDGVAELARQGTIDPHRVAIVGLSYGGYAALAGVTVQHGLYRCAVSWGGITDLNDLLSKEAEIDESDFLGDSLSIQMLHKYLGTDSNNDPAIDRLSPALRAADADAPILVMYGTDDTVVSTRQSEAMISALTAAGKPVQLVKVAGEDHWLSQGPSRTAILKAAVDFVEKYNPATVNQ